MATKKNLSKQIKKERELLSKYAYVIVMALCVQILVYLVLLNIIPFSSENPRMIVTNGYEYAFVQSQEDNTYYGIKYVNNAVEENVYINGKSEFSYKEVKEYCKEQNLKIISEIFLWEDVNNFYKEEWATYRGYDNNGDGKISNDEWGAQQEGNAVSTYSSDKKIDNGMAFIYAYNMVILVASIIVSIWYMMTVLEENEGDTSQKIKGFFKKNIGLLFLLLFMVWCFISSLLAYDPHRSFIGCYNLRDGYLSFMFYAAILVCILIIGNNEQYRKRVINTFLVTATVLAILTLGDYVEYNVFGNNVFPVVKENGTGSVSAFDNSAGEAVYMVTKYASTTSSILSGIFNNTNHYAYYLTISIIVAAVMAIKDTDATRKLGYLVSFTIMLTMLIINNTFGSYLGVAITVFLLYIYCILDYVGIFNKKDSKEMCDNKNDSTSMFVAAVLLVILIVCSFSINDASNSSIVGKNFADLKNGIMSILGDSKNDSNEGSTISNTEMNENIATEQVSSEAAEAGSGRWGIWLNTIKVIKEYPIFGCGLENMLYKMIEIVEEEGTGNAEGRSHNLILQLSATVGIPGMLLYFAGMICIFINAVKRLKSGDLYACMGTFVIVAYMISSMTGNSGFYTSGYFYIFVGMVAISACDDKKKLVKTKK